MNFKLGQDPVRLQWRKLPRLLQPRYACPQPDLEVQARRLASGLTSPLFPKPQCPTAAVLNPTDRQCDAENGWRRTEAAVVAHPHPWQRPQSPNPCPADARTATLKTGQSASPGIADSRRHCCGLQKTWKAKQVGS